MESDLESIAARVHEMAESARTLLGFSEGERDSFFSNMEVCFKRILQAANSCAAGRSAIQSTVSELTAAVATMHEAVQEIRAIEIQIQRIALNANIRSAHIGAPGDALNVIADRMHHVALDSNRNTEEVAGLLDSMREATRVVSRDAPDTGDPLAELRREISDLHVSSESSFKYVHQVAALGSELGAALRSARAELKVGPVFAETVARARGALDRIDGDTASGPADLEEFARHYTMHAEREVHESVVRGETMAAVAPEGLGDNVELF
jgi:methyl-accepting chemotaxis protein